MRQVTRSNVPSGKGRCSASATLKVAFVTPCESKFSRAFSSMRGVRSVTNATFKVADAEHLPFPDGTFDRVTCRIAPHHFPNVFQFMHEVACVLKPGGIFLLIDCMAPSDPKLDRFDNQI